MCPYKGTSTLKTRPCWAVAVGGANPGQGRLWVRSIQPVPLSLGPRDSCIHTELLPPGPSPWLGRHWSQPKRRDRLRSEGMGEPPPAKPQRVGASAALKGDGWPRCKSLQCCSWLCGLGKVTLTILGPRLPCLSEGNRRPTLPGCGRVQGGGQACAWGPAIPGPAAAVTGRPALDAASSFPSRTMLPRDALSPAGQVWGEGSRRPRQGLRLAGLSRLCCSHPVSSKMLPPLGLRGADTNHGSGSPPRTVGRGS